LTFIEPPLAQDPSYHQFADTRTIAGIHNFWNVVSNVFFLNVGWLGLRFLFRQYYPRFKARCFNRKVEIRPYLFLFLGVMLTSFGSAYYHWMPNDTHLVWDRLPMAIGFMALFTITIMERISFRWGLRLLYPLILLGIFSVVYWYLGDLRGGGDLRLYVDVQFYPMLAIPLMVSFFPSTYTLDKSTWVVVCLYALSKLFEIADVQVFQLTGELLSGHTLKHVTAAVATYVILWSLQNREFKGMVTTNE
jgi:hypothetical protein